jgi:hypothetical protein
MWKGGDMLLLTVWRPFSEDFLLFCPPLLLLLPEIIEEGPFYCSPAAELNLRFNILNWV